jgi:hypothetical protein
VIEQLEQKSRGGEQQSEPDERSKQRRRAAFERPFAIAGLGLASWRLLHARPIPFESHVRT